MTEKLRNIGNDGIKIFNKDTSGRDNFEAKNCPYKLAMRKNKSERTIIKIGNVSIGGDNVTIIAGPCAVESKEQMVIIATEIAKCGADIIRGGAYKPRSSPYSFQGLGKEGLKILHEIRKEFRLPVITEVMDISHLKEVARYSDIIQIGARNMQSFSLLKAVGKLDIPVLLKRGLSSTIDEWLMAAEYILVEGNWKVILCERGIRTFEKATRNTLDLSAVPLLKELTHLPIVVDPSHGTGKRSLVPPMAKAAIVAGADGLLLEVHNQPDKAVSDGDQSIDLNDFKVLMREIGVLVPVVKKFINESEVAVCNG